MTDNATSHVSVGCAVLHTDDEGNVVPCPGYPHAESGPQPDEFGLHHCPRCTDAVRNLEEHLTWCKEPETDPLADARQLLAADAEARAAACQAEIQAILDRYNMRLEISTPQIAIVPNP